MSRIKQTNFFKALFTEYFKEHKGFIEIREINESVRCEFFDSIESLIEVINSKRFKGNIYFGVGPRSIRKGNKSAIKHITSLWIDIDYGKTGHKKKSHYPNKEVAIQAIDKFPIKPSIIVCSGYGLHCYWILKSPVDITNPDFIENILNNIIIKLKGDKGTHNLDRILRVPFTFNSKVKSNPVQSDIIKFDPDLKYEISEFESIAKSGCAIGLDSLSTRSRDLLENIHSEDYDSRSEADFRVILEMTEQGFSDEEITEVFDKHPIGEKHREQKGYLSHSIKKAREIIDDNGFKADKRLYENGKIISAPVATKICTERKIVHFECDFFIYKNGCYRKIKEEAVKKIILDTVGNKLSKYKMNEIYDFMKIVGEPPENKISSSEFINLHNGLFIMDFQCLTSHTHQIFSTNQLNIKYLPDAKCPRWIKTLNEIFEDDQEKVEILQEFFGLCLTKETKYEKALFLIGEGSNGKSVISQVLESILGEENYSAIPLEKLKNAHYTINLHQKLANISIETNSKSEVYDSIFKAVVSGDTITGDQKFKNPVKFRPYCKLIIASNNMPRVDDKTSAFFRRLIILRFNRQFSDVEQNKKLKQELKSELDGIFLWALEGLNRLEERKNFNNPKSVANELEEYRKENNNVLVFVEDACLRSPEKSMAKNDIYNEYNLWCKDNGFRSLSKIKFGKELTRNFKDITDETDGTKRLWSGIGTV